MPEVLPVPPRTDPPQASTATVGRLRVEQLIVMCRDESTGARRQELGACFELFRRALSAQDGAAWAAVERQYRSLLCRWLSARGLPPSDVEDLAQEALTRFWQTLSTRPDALESRFDRVSALLKYLHQCAVSTHLDRLRAGRRVQRLQEECARALEDTAAATPDASALDALCKEEALGKVRRWMHEQVESPEEIAVMQLSLDEGLTPAQIQQRHPELFPDTAAVWRVKERLLKRARRALVEPE